MSVPTNVRSVWPVIGVILLIVVLIAGAVVVFYYYGDRRKVSKKTAEPIAIDVKTEIVT